MQVYGTVSGKISVDGSVEIFPGARVEGELYATEPAVKISEGGVFDGELIMVKPESGARPDERAAPPADGAAGASSGAPPEQGQEP